MVFENEYLMKRDRDDFYPLFDMYGLADRLEYHVGINFAVNENEVVLVDEADCFIFE
jgi:hypothetical protein